MCGRARAEGVGECVEEDDEDVVGPRRREPPARRRPAWSGPRPGAVRLRAKWTTDEHRSGHARSVKGRAGALLPLNVHLSFSRR